jgi:hypothetical protein
MIHAAVPLAGGRKSTAIFQGDQCWPSKRPISVIGAREKVPTRLGKAISKFTGLAETGMVADSTITYSNIPATLPKYFHGNRLQLLEAEGIGGPRLSRAAKTLLADGNDRLLRLNPAVSVSEKEAAR